MCKIIKVSVISLLIAVLFAGCGTIEDGSSEAPKDNITFEAEVIEAGNSLLVTPDKESNEYKSSDKMSVGLTNSKITDKNGKEIIKEDLKAGDMIKITYNGTILESYPAQISASAVEVTGHNILIEGYLAIIDDIYKEDSGLNGDIEMIALDTTGWTDVTVIEKDIIFSKLKDIYNVTIVEGTYDKLAEDGLIDKEKLYFPKGILITISDMKISKDKKIITYAITKWRAGDGAVGADASKAKYDGSEWKITKKNRWIS